MTGYVQPTRLPARRWLLTLALGCLALNAVAQTEIPYNGPKRNTIEYKKAGNDFEWSPVTGDTPRSNQPYRPDLSGGSASTVEPKYKWTPQLPYEHKGGSDAKATINWPVIPEKVSDAASKAAAGAAAGLATGNGYVAFAGLACAFVCEPLMQALVDWGASQLKRNPDGSLAVEYPDDDSSYSRSDGRTWGNRNYNLAGYYSRESVCSAVLDLVKASPGNSASYIIPSDRGCDIYRSAPGSGVGNYTVFTEGNSQCPVGAYVSNSNECFADQPYQTSPLGDYIQSNYTGKGWDHHWAKITAGLVAAGVNVFTDGTGTTITGPGVVPVSTSTTSTPINVVPGTTSPAPTGHTGPTDSGTQTTTTTTTARNTYRPGSGGPAGSPNAGPSMSTSTQTTTTTNITNNITNNTSSTVITNTTEADDAPEEKEEDFCEKHPDSLSCTELGEPEDVSIPTETIRLDYEYTDLFGNGSCPSDKYQTVAGKTIKVWDWQNTCSYLVSFVQPLILMLSAFAGFMIVAMGASKP